MNVSNPKIQQFARALSAVRKFHGTLVEPGWTPGPTQTAWHNVHALMAIDKPRTIPGAKDLMDFYHDGVSKARDILDSMLRQFTREPHHLSHIRIQEMDPENLLHNANRLFISHNAVFAYCHSVARYLYARLEAEGIATQSFIKSAAAYLAEDSIKKGIVEAMGAFARAAELPVENITVAPEGIDDVTRERLKRHGGGSIKAAFMREFDIWIKYLCFLGIGDDLSHAKSNKLFPRFDLIVAAERRAISQEYLFSLSALAAYVRQP